MWDVVAKKLSRLRFNGKALTDSIEVIPCTNVLWIAFVHVIEYVRLIIFTNVIISLWKRERKKNICVIKALISALVDSKEIGKKVDGKNNIYWRVSVFHLRFFFSLPLLSLILYNAIFLIVLLIFYVKSDVINIQIRQKKFISEKPAFFLLYIELRRFYFLSPSFISSVLHAEEYLWEI